MLGDATLEALAQRIDVKQDSRVEGQRHPFGATIKVRTPSGTVERLIADPSGEPETFPDTVRIEEKFMTLSQPVLHNEASSLYFRLASLETIADVRQLMR